jgi:hypothetical protein
MAMAAIRERVIQDRHVWVRYDKFGHVMAMASTSAGVQNEALREIGMPVAHVRRPSYYHPIVAALSR